MSPEPNFGPDPHTDVKVGQQPPSEFTVFNPTDQEAELQGLVDGPDTSFFEDIDSTTATREACLTDPTLRGKPDVSARLDGMKSIDEANLLGDASGLLATWLKNRLLKLKIEQPQVALNQKHVWSLLEEARQQGGPELSVAADELLQGADSQRIGSSVPLATLSKCVWEHGVGTGHLQWCQHHWRVYDFVDKLPPTNGWEQTLLQGPTQPDEEELRQCLVLHCAAGLLLAKTGDCPTLQAVQTQANLLRQDMLQQAREACRQLGPSPEELPRSEADLRVFAHDLLHWGHDKDYRTLAAFPPELLAHHTLRIVRMSTAGELIQEVIHGIHSLGRARDCIWLLVHQGHMRSLVPPTPFTEPPVIREVLAAGWECHLEAAAGSEALVRARTYLQCPRCVGPEDQPRRTGLSRPPAVLGLHSLDPVSRAGAWSPAPLEVKDLPTSTTFSDDKLRAWLGSQAPVFDKALLHGLDLLEVYAGKARATEAVLNKGGLALCLGLDHGQDFRRARDRALGYALVHHLQPRHLWAAFPCSPFCAWVRLAILRQCDMGPRLREGRLHLAYALSLVQLQTDAHRHGHLENPLTSAAWKEPLALKQLSDPLWLWARLDQCQTGLSSPQGGLHLKPTLIRTTDPLMHETLSLRCPGTHSHDLVQGAATAGSAMYSPHMAHLIAQVVLAPHRDRAGGGGGASFSNAARVGGGPEASFSPGSTTTPGWFEGLKGPVDPRTAPIKPEVRTAVVNYLTFVKETDYSRDGFSKAAAFGAMFWRWRVAGKKPTEP